MQQPKGGSLLEKANAKTYLERKQKTGEQGDWFVLA
jgi:hypothetical protein